jgi:hypothetical protein
MEIESLQLLIEQLRKANVALTAEVQELRTRLEAKEDGEGEAGAETPTPQPQNDDGSAVQTPGADSALALLHQKAEQAREKDRVYVEAMRGRGLSVGTAEDFQKYKAARG